MSQEPTASLKIIRDWLETNTGLFFPDHQLPILAARIARALATFHAQTLDDVCRRLVENPGRVVAPLVAAITIGETYFFRNHAQFEALQARILPELLRRLPPGSPFVVWSAGCATGEEPYSLAMWIHEHAPQLLNGRARIVATDINADYLEVARAGSFREKSFRQVAPLWRKKYFSQRGETYTVKDPVRNLIQFRPHNLVSGQLPEGLSEGQVALVFCRNVLIYFTPQTTLKVLALFRRVLVPDGILMLGHAESSSGLRAWASEYHPGTVYYRLVTPPPAGPLTPGPVPRRPPKVQAPASRVPAQRPGSVPVEPARDPAPGPLPLDRLAQQARAAADEGRLADAEQALEAYLAREPTSVEGHFLRALVAEQACDLERAREALRRALYLDKRFVLGHYFLAVFQEREGQGAEALRGYQSVCRLLKREPDGRVLQLGDWLTAGIVRQLSEARIAELTQET